MSEQKKNWTKVEGKVERWWLSSIMNIEGIPTLFGDFYGLESIGFKPGKFEPMNGLEKIDFINGIVVTDKAIIKLGETQTLTKAMADMVKREKELSVRKPDKS